MFPPRRRFVAGATLCFTTPLLRAAGALAPTPPQMEGPFYPLTLPLDRDNDLTRVEGRDGVAYGAITDISGHVRAPDGRALAGVLVEIWQVNGYGRYHHPDDTQDRPVDPAFQGYGQCVTDAAGAYRFRTVKPVAYPGRTPHVHFALTAPRMERFVTQMYLADSPRNDRDMLWRQLDPEARARLTVALAVGTGGVLEARFDLVVAAVAA